MNNPIPRALRLAADAIENERDAIAALKDIVELLSDANIAPEALSDDGLLRNIITTIPHFVFWKDRDCVYQGANAAFASIAGFENPTDIAGCTDYDLPWKREEADFFVATDKRVMSSGVSQLNIIEPQKQADGRDRYLETSKVPLRNEAGEVVGILGIFQDVTERKQLERDLLDAKDAAEASDRAKSDFLAAMSHELRTPLTLILGPMESLLQDHVAELSPEVLRIVQCSHRNACRLKALTDDILDFSKGQAGLLAVAGEWVDLSTHVREVVGDMQPAALAQEIDLSFESEREGIRAYVDVRKLDKMLLNLVGNALKFTPSQGHVRIRLSHDAGRFRLDVTDTGIGIAPEDHARLFQRFVQVDAGSTRKYGGTGLGLALVKQFSDLMGGSVELQSALGKGATFTLTLPTGSDQNCGPASEDTPAQGTSREDARRRALSLRTSAQQASAATLQPSTEPQGETREGELPRLLVAEDNGDLREYIVNLFKADYQVEVTGNGAQALAIARTFKPEVILSDVMMPEMDGHELVKHVRADERLRTTPIILLTARAGAEASVSSLESGADDHVSKPFNPSDLRSRVRAALRLHRLNVALRDAKVQAAETERLAGLGRLLAKLSHEINNPVNVIVNSAGSLREYTDSALRYVATCTAALPEGELTPSLVKLREELGWDFIKEDFPLAVEQISEAASRVKDLQTDFRLFLRGEHAVNLEEGDLNASVLSTVEQARRLQAVNATIEHKLGVVGQVFFDHPRFCQALLNI
ncbi:MAG: hypothetical protein RJA70_4986, partial [Pseudomonadota bacterium]